MEALENLSILSENRYNTHKSPRKDLSMETDSKSKPLDMKSTLKAFIIESFMLGAESTDFLDEDSFMEKGIIDSTGVLELLQYIEETFEIKVEDDEVLPENLDSLVNLECFIKRKTAGSDPAQ